MSIKLMSAIFETEMMDLSYKKDNEERKTKASTAKLVLLALADHANDYGESTYPGYDRLEVKTSLSRQGISDTLIALRDNGLLEIDVRGSRIGTNSYTINIGAFPPMFREVEELKRLVKPLDQLESSHLTTASQATRLESSVKPLNKTSRESKIDVFGFMEMSDKLAKEQKADETEEVIVKLERGLKVNIQRSNSNQSAARRILKDGRSVDQWLTWVIQDEWRASHMYLYADLEKVWRDFPQAFGNESGYNPQGLEVGL